MASKRIKTWEAVLWGALPGILMMGWVLWMYGFRGLEALHLLFLLFAALGGFIYWRVNKRGADRSD